MKKFCALLLTLSLLLAGASPALSSMDAPDDEKAIELMNEAFGTADVAARIAILREAVRTAPENVEVLLGCAYLLYNSDPDMLYADECERMLRGALALAGGAARAAAIQMLAELLSFSNRQGEAIALLNAEIEKTPEDEDLRISLATSYYYDGQNEAALAQLEALAEDSPRNLDALRLRGTILTDECRWEEALSAFRQIEAGWPEAPDGIYGQYLTYRASGNFTRAVRALDTLLRMDIDDALWVERARIRLWMMMEPEAAIGEADALLRSDPGWIDALLVKLGALLMLERYGDAEPVVDAIGGQDAGFGRLMRGLLRMNEGRWDDAVREIESLIEETPGWYLPWLHLGMARINGENDPEAALAAYAEAFALDGAYGDMDLFLQLGHAYRAQGNPLEAARAYLEADALTFEDPSPLYFAAMAHMDAGLLDGLADTVREMERRYPGWYETMLARVILEDVRGDAQAALEAFEALKAKFPFPCARLWALEGTLTASAGREGGAALIADWIARDEANQTPSNHDGYAYALLREGDADAALAALAQAEALLDAAPEETMDTADGRVAVELTRAAALLEKGDMQGALDALERAVAFGVAPGSLRLFQDYVALHGNEAFEALAGEAPTEAEWDLSILVTIPE